MQFWNHFYTKSTRLSTETPIWDIAPQPDPNIPGNVIHLNQIFSRSLHFFQLFQARGNEPVDHRGMVVSLHGTNRNGIIVLS